MQRLQRPVPSRTPFVELRGSALLKAPLRISGLYVRPDADTLVREVRAPYAETTSIRAGEVAIRRGDSTRRFPLARAPELAGLQAGFGALLAGDGARLREHFAVSSQGSRAQWTLRLVPVDPVLAAKLRDIVLYGHGAELRCIETRPVEGDVQRTLLAGTAQAAIGIEAAAALAALCHGDAR